jgi:translation elongation factor EF-1beta
MIKLFIQQCTSLNITAIWDVMPCSLVVNMQTINQTIRRNIAQDGDLHSHHQDNL